MSPPTHPRRETWIIDGHNVIFHVPELEALQTGHQKEEARHRLVLRARGFGAARGAHMVVVFDGVPGTHSGGDAHGQVEVLYEAYGGKADDRIAFRADQLVAGGNRVYVVSNDRELGSRLHRNARVTPVDTFWKLSRTKTHPSGKVVFAAPDIERFFLEREAEVLEAVAGMEPPQVAPVPASRRRRNPVPAPAQRAAPAPASRPVRNQRPAEPVSPEEQRRLKKERGQRKQARRLAQSSRRRKSRKRR